MRQGEYLASIAYRAGCDPDEVWDDPKNAHLRESARTREVLCPGDVLFLPNGEARPREVNLHGSNSFEAVIPSITVRVLFAENGAALASRPCVVQILGAPLERETDADGALTFSVGVDVRDVIVIFPGHYCVYRLQIGDLDPINERSGQIARLQQLGHLAPGAHSAVTDEELQAGFASLLRAAKKPTDDVNAEETLEDLKRRFGA